MDSSPVSESDYVRCLQLSCVFKGCWILICVPDVPLRFVFLEMSQFCMPQGSLGIHPVLSSSSVGVYSAQKDESKLRDINQMLKNVDTGEEQVHSLHACHVCLFTTLLQYVTFIMDVHR